MVSITVFRKVDRFIPLKFGLLNKNQLIRRNIILLKTQILIFFFRIFTLIATKKSNQKGCFYIFKSGQLFLFFNRRIRKSLLREISGNRCFFKF